MIDGGKEKEKPGHISRCRIAYFTGRSMMCMIRHQALPRQKMEVYLLYKIGLDAKEIKYRTRRRVCVLKLGRSQAKVFPYTLDNDYLTYHARQCARNQKPSCLNPSLPAYFILFCTISNTYDQVACQAPSNCERNR